MPSSIQRKSWRISWKTSCGLRPRPNGRRLRLEAGEVIYTDTETLFLPDTASRFDSQEDNFRFLKTTATYLWAQTRFGTWQRGVIEALAGYEAAGTALRLFHMLETLRLDGCIARELPGIHRDMQHLIRHIRLFRDDPQTLRDR